MARRRKVKILESQGCVPVGRNVPSWIVKACDFFLRFNDLQSFTVYVHYGNLQTTNRKLKEHKYAKLDAGDRAAIIVDTTYLKAEVFFLSNMTKELNFDSLTTIAHEMSHIDIRYNVMDRVKAELTFSAILEDLNDMKLLAIEERYCELSVNRLIKSGIIDQYLEGKIA